MGQKQISLHKFKRILNKNMVGAYIKVSSKISADTFYLDNRIQRGNDELRTRIETIVRVGEFLYETQVDSSDEVIAMRTKIENPDLMDLHFGKSPHYHKLEDVLIGGVTDKRVISTEVKLR